MMQRARARFAGLLSFRFAGLAGLLVAGFCCASCEKSTTANPAAPSADVLARVGTRELKASEFDGILTARQATSPVPLDPATVLEEWTQRETIAQGARRAGLEDDPEVKEILTSAMIAKFKERQLSAALDAASVADAEVQEAYEQQKGQFTAPEKARIAVLFMAAPKQDGPAAGEARGKIAAALALAKAESSPNAHGFGALAINNSEDQESRYRGGEIGWVDRKQYPARIDFAAIEAAFALQSPGQISDVVQGERGFYAVMLLEKRAATPVPFAEVAPIIRGKLLAKKREQVEATFLAKLRAEVPVEMHPERLPARPASKPAVPSLPSTLP
jgi:peptidyl-prolyl cis-trans isomerase C